MLNKIFIMGRLGQDPEVRYTQAGKPVASFSLAVDRDYIFCLVLRSSWHYS